MSSHKDTKAMVFKLSNSRESIVSKLTYLLSVPEDSENCPGDKEPIHAKHLHGLLGFTFEHMKSECKPRLSQPSSPGERCRGCLAAGR